MVRTRIRVLYVEDDECLHEIVSAVLAGEGLDVTAVGGVGDGLRALEAGGIHLVIADYHLPDGNGANMLHTARARGLLRDTSALLLTSEPRPLGVGGFLVLHKPVDCDLLLRAVHGAIGSRMHRESGVRYKSSLDVADPTADPSTRAALRGFRLRS
jgi:DNA-binding response OmpR family regulator